jgi:pimeloyl-ACP methyl ester carboxylesterase
MRTVASSDGTSIAYERAGSGPGVVLVGGGVTDRSENAPLAAELAKRFTVFNYDRRGRGGSGDTPPYAVDREIEDLAAVIAAVAGADGPAGTAMVFGGSSGAALALEASARLPAITALALWEPPYHVDATAPHLPDDFADQLAQLVAAGRPGEAVERFMVEAAEVPAEVVASMRRQPEWAGMEAVAPTLAYEAAVLGPGNRMPTERLAAVTQPTLVLSGDRSPAWMGAAARAVAAALPHATHRVPEGQAHNVAAEALAPELLEFFTAAHPAG